jgi:hypothetical protein
MNAYEAVELAGDWLRLIERSLLLTDDPAELAELDAELDQALAILESATAVVEREAAQRACLELSHRRERLADPDRRLARRCVRELERRREGAAAVRALGLDHLLRPRQ